MSSTRRSDSDSPLAYEKYMSAPEFADLRPIPGNVVLSKALLYTDPAARETAFFLQAMSMQNGGLRAMAEQLMAWFPERCREDPSPKGCRVTFSAQIAQLNGRGKFSATLTLLSDFLTDLAINPQVSLTHIDCPCFANLGDALIQFQKVKAESVWQGYVTTESGRVILETLDKALRLSRMVVIEGPAGAGKSFSAEAWCDADPGKARCISLTGITTRTTLFQKIGRSIGIAICQRTASKLQGRIEDFFSRSGMMLVIDEAHYLWPQGLRVTSSPELVDWVDTALVNQGVPVALLCTDQFSKLKNRVEKNTGWTSEQFIRRVFRFKKLALPKVEDVRAVTESLLSSVYDETKRRWLPSCQSACPAGAIDALASWATEGETPYSCVASCIDEARDFARLAGRVIVSREDIVKALSEGQIPSDTALKAAFSMAPAERRGRSNRASLGASVKPNKAFVAAPPLPPTARAASFAEADQFDTRKKQMSKDHSSDAADQAAIFA